MIKKILSVMLAVIMLVMFALPVSAADHSEVWGDLASSVLNGARFDPKDYPKNTSDHKIYLLTVSERGYNAADMSDYGFYIYLYNPSGSPIRVGAASNKIQMATAWDNDSNLPTDYSKFNYELISVSNEEGYEYVYYKAKVTTEVNGTKSIADYVLSLARFYDISGFEALRTNASSSIEYAVGMRFAYYGTEAAGNKTCKASVLDTIDLQVHHTYFRTESSSHGVGHQNQLNAVYFNVPADYWLSYDFLYAIKCYWEEYRTTPMIVTDNSTVAAHLTTWRGRGNGSGYNSSNPLSFFSKPSTIKTGAVTTITYPWTYNMNLKGDQSDRYHVYKSTDNCETVTWSFFSDEIELRQSDISSDIVMEYWKTNSGAHRERMITEKGVDYYFDRQAGPQTHTIMFDETFSMSSYASNHNWLQRLWNYNIFNGGAGTNLKDDYSGILAIETVSAEHLGLRAEEVAARYFVNPTDADDFKAVIDEGKKNGMKTVVFRFAVTDYFAEEVTAMVNGEVVDGTTYRAEQTVFLDFDIISLTFSKDTDFFMIPVSSTPTDFIGGIDAPRVDQDSGLQYLPEYAGDLWEELEGPFRMMQKMFMIFLGAILIALIVFFVVSMIRPNNPVVIKITDTAKQGADKLTNRKKNKKGGKKK